MDILTRLNKATATEIEDGNEAVPERDWSDEDLKKYPIKPFADVPITPIQLFNTCNEISKNMASLGNIDKSIDGLMFCARMCLIKPDRKHRDVSPIFSAYDFNNSPFEVLKEMEEFTCKSLIPGQDIEGSSSKDKNSKDDLVKWMSDEVSSYAITCEKELSKLTDYEICASLGAWCYFHLRLITKDSKAMTAYFMPGLAKPNNKVNKLVRGIYGIECPFKFPLHQSNIYDAMHSKMEVVEGSVRSILCHSMAVYCNSSDTDVRSCLSRLSVITLIGYGLTAYTWLLRASSAWNLSPNSLNAAMFDEPKTGVTCNNVFMFMAKYNFIHEFEGIPRIRSKYYLFCRLFDSSYCKSVGRIGNDCYINACIAMVEDKTEGIGQFAKPVDKNQFGEGIAKKLIHYYSMLL